ncbi:MAG: indole-3-glycerol phosphate synthase TrpC [Gemmatimonadetes bacterium]|nr:indole-3-glycerol phosphate synthase TrpC [Gemmatimonadota bacterium]MDA1102855.1 indole-3-glycerol phosphate synthase TrpC [Gemmatimonadota bacterium]
MPETQGQDSLPGILASIVSTKRSEVDEARTRAHDIEGALDTARPVRDFRGALARPGTVSLIAECKRRSPGAGAIRPDINAAELASGYQSAGASALSVLTDGEYFGGSLQDLVDVGAATTLPVLRKDFTIDPVQVIEARAAGADAVLLIVRILDDVMLELLHREGEGLGMSVLVEVHDATELERALRLGSVILGVNNRDLATFTTDLGTTERLLGQLPDDVVVVSESGIRNRADVERLGSAGVDAVLVGEALLRAEDPAEAARALSGVSNRGRNRV